MRLPTFQGDAIARPLLDFLLVHHPAHFHLSELVREFADPTDDLGTQELLVTEALARLEGSGLIHRTAGGFVFASWTALRAKELISES
jgi:DNA-binding transcriptional regulator PaaX